MTTTRALLVAAMATVLAGCRAPDTVVLVFVQGATPRPIHQLQVEATVAGETRHLDVPDSPSGAIFLPTSFSVQIPRGQSGPFWVSVTALDEGRQPMVSGQATIADLPVGEESSTVVLLGGAPAPDAGP
jgi:hypothetical protein